MECRHTVKRPLAKVGASEGDAVDVVVDSRPHRGVGMPHHGFSGDDIRTVKLRECEGI